MLIKKQEKEKLRSHTLRKKISIEIENIFPNEISTKEINRATKWL